jgi:uncharacterized protein YutE (UPF0331/DUF86 family)
MEHPQDPFALRRAPTSYAECFEGLRAVHQLDHELATRLVRMVRFHNLPVQRYWDADPKQILQYGRENLGDFEAYLRVISNIIGQSV